ncbi:MAG: nuclear transport factor 2 family protein [Vicinamibacterales bacterium]
MNKPPAQRLAVAILAFFAATAALSLAQSASTAEQQILKADTDRFKAMVDGDVAMLDRLLAVELSYVHTSARIEDRHAFLYGIKSGKTRYSSIIPSEQQVHVMGTVATVVGVAVVRGEEEQGIDIGIRYTSVHVLREGRWQMVACQSTRIAPNETLNPRIG